MLCASCVISLLPSLHDLGLAHAFLTELPFMANTFSSGSFPGDHAAGLFVVTVNMGKFLFRWTE